MEERPVRQNLWELAVLALLREGPMHPYEMQRLLRERHKDELLVLKRGSLYHAIDRLQELKLIEAVSTGRSGRRPERTTYRINAAGRRTLLHWIQKMIAAPIQESSEFMAAMSFLVHLSPREAIPRLEERMRCLEKNIAETEARMAMLAAGIMRINLIETEYLCAMKRAELAWIRGLVGELRSGQFDWDFKTIAREAKAAKPQKER
jgi:DNA-binding PadR family transcriptional regulator